MGNPGVGKSAILNALGGSFLSEFSIIANPVCSQVVTIGDKTVELIDLPGISDAGGGHVMSKDLELLRDIMNSRGEVLLVFVIKLSNGRISLEDFAILKTLFLNLAKSPKIGLIVTQVRDQHIDLIDNDAYRNCVIKLLQESGVNTCYLEMHRWPILRLHGAEGFSDNEKRAIRNYVCSFVPSQPPFRASQQILSLFKRILT